MKARMHAVVFVVLAMNWEGHEDWMKDHPAALEFEQAIKHAEPLPPKPCGAEEASPNNPYEQVPLRCPGTTDPPE